MRVVVEAALVVLAVVLLPVTLFVVGAGTAAMVVAAGMRRRTA